MELEFILSTTSVILALFVLVENTIGLMKIVEGIREVQRVAKEIQEGSKAILKEIQEGNKAILSAVQEGNKAVMEALERIIRKSEY